MAVAINETDKHMNNQVCDQTPTYIPSEILPVPNSPKENKENKENPDTNKQQICVVIDLDDTLFPTTHYNANQMYDYPMFNMKKFDKKISEVISKFDFNKSVVKYYIISRSNVGWMQLLFNELLPNLSRKLRNFTIISTHNKAGCMLALFKYFICGEKLNEPLFTAKMPECAIVWDNLEREENRRVEHHNYVFDSVFNLDVTNHYTNILTKKQHTQKSKQNQMIIVSNRNQTSRTGSNQNDIDGCAFLNWLKNITLKEEHIGIPEKTIIAPATDTNSNNPNETPAQNSVQKIQKTLQLQNSSENSSECTEQNNHTNICTNICANICTKAKSKYQIICIGDQASDLQSGIDAFYEMQLPQELENTVTLKFIKFAYFPDEILIRAQWKALLKYMSAILDYRTNAEVVITLNEKLYKGINLAKFSQMAYIPNYVPEHLFTPIPPIPITPISKIPEINLVSPVNST